MVGGLVGEGGGHARLLVGVRGPGSGSFTFGARAGTVPTENLGADAVSRVTSGGSRS
ncbi:hypothetical protein KCH_65400 [Kitasatospora cheerisanensis KCTC 2395]|uniref:Uncharacterized protein n=1 Tax=Kitasatospora cheerisanensis KCTC 2395 TaxID=1348663 RepID=A0A066YV74_9ACTN|nr:hypothetical protein KCH_65400 [Kitasatospora cheerisanensis KCTC 2395]